MFNVPQEAMCADCWVGHIRDLSIFHILLIISVMSEAVFNYKWVSSSLISKETYFTWSWKPVLSVCPFLKHVQRWSLHRQNLKGQPAWGWCIAAVVTIILCESFLSTMLKWRIRIPFYIIELLCFKFTNLRHSRGTSCRVVPGQFQGCLGFSFGYQHPR